MSISGQINRKLFVSIELKSPVKQTTYIAQQYTFLQGRGVCHYPHKYYICISVGRSNSTLCQMYPSKIPKKSFLTFVFWQTKRQNIKRMKDTLQESSTGKKKHTNYASREMEFRNNNILSVISAISQKPSSNELCLSPFSHRQDTTTVTGYSGAPLTEKYSYIKYIHRRYEYIISFRNAQ